MKSRLLHRFFIKELPLPACRQRRVVASVGVEITEMKGWPSSFAGPSIGETYVGKRKEEIRVFSRS